MWRMIIFSLFLFSSASAQYTYLYVNTTQGPWRGDYGTIENATIAVHPKGLFSQVNVYLEFSGGNSPYIYQGDTLEVTYEFALPTGSQIVDLWLWVEDKIMPGYIMDRWTASNIYESIVSRRRDPALLTKTYNDRYLLKVYPLAFGGSRRVRLSYIVPNSVDRSQTTVPLPLHLLNPPYKPYAKPLSVLFWPDSADGQVALSGIEGVVPQEKQDSLYGRELEFVIPPSSLSGSISLRSSSILRNGIFARAYTGEGDGAFQIAVRPSDVFGLSISRRVVMLVDHETAGTTMTASTLRDLIRENLGRGLSPSDTFCILVGNLFGVRVVGGRWFVGDTSGIGAAEDSLRIDLFTGTSNLPVLLQAGIDSASAYDSRGVIWLVGSSTQYGNFTLANQIITQVLARSSTRVPMHIADLNNVNAPWWYFNGRSWSGNEYLYENLARLTGGSTTRWTYGSDARALVVASFEKIAGQLETFDLTTVVGGGLTYGRISPEEGSLRTVGINALAIQTGRFIGQRSMTIDLAGRYRGTVVARRIEIPADEVEDGDRTDVQIWAGMTIDDLESVGATNQVVNQIINLSIDARVLSEYTAFLALEPSDTTLPCLTCRDETQSTNVEEAPETSPDSLLSAYPNPFNASTTLRVTMPKGARASECSFKIFNILGQEVAAFDVSDMTERATRTFTWNGATESGSPVATGLYVAIFQTPTSRHSVKLLMVK